MLSDIRARVYALDEKAEELNSKGHVLRAAENYGRAAEAARALGADNIPMLYLQLRKGAMLGAYAASAPDGTADPRILATHRTQFVALLSDAVGALERRRAAGTLLDGKCSAAEEAWVIGQLPRHPSQDASWAPLIGYEQFLYAAISVLNILASPRVYAAECSAAQLQSFAQHIVHAADLMQQPRRHGDSTTANETKFANGLFMTTVLVSAAHGRAQGLATHLVQLLTGAWQRLQRSGVLQARRIEEHHRFPRRRMLSMQ